MHWLGTLVGVVMVGLAVAAQQPALANTATNLPGQHRILVIAVNFQDTALTCDLAAIATLLFAETNSVAALYTEMSDGAVRFTGDIVGPYTIDFANTNPGCAQFAWAAAADAAAQAAGIPVSDYQHKVYVLPHHYQCGWSGWATTGGNPSRAWVMRCDNADVYAHELGHNLGLQHAGADYDNDGTVDDEYGDNSDIMGRIGQGLRQLNAPHKAQLGWLPAEKIASPTGPTTVQLAPLELAPGDTPDPQALKIFQADSNTAYYVSYRRPLGFDANLLTKFRDTLSVHHNTTGSARTRLVATVADNVPFVDSVTGLTIALLAHNDTAATVQLQYECYPAAPAINFDSAELTAIRGSATSSTVTVSNRDSRVCGQTLFQLQAITPTGWTTALNPSTLLLAPGQTGTAQLSVTTSTKSRPRNSAITITVTDNLNSAHTAAGQQNIVVTTAAALPDTAAPTTPANFQALAKKRMVRLRWDRATDNVAVTGYVVWRDGISVGQSKGRRFNDRTALTGESYIYSVTAFDKTGHSSAPSTSVTVIAN